MTLVGRDDVLSICHNALDGARSGRGSVIVVRGGAGAGKTALLREFGNTADAAMVLSATGSYGERERASGLVARLLSRSDADAGGRPHAVLATLRDAGDPVVLLVDDLQWCDRESQRWLSALAEQSGHWPVVLVTAVSDGAPGWDSAEVEDVLFAGTHHMKLDNLDHEEVREMLELLHGEAPADRVVAECLRATGGVPWLVAGFHDAEAIALSARVRLRRMGPAALDVFMGVALLGAVPIDVLTRFCGRPGAEVIGLCAELSATGLLNVGETETSVTHPLVRRSLLQHGSPAELRALRRRAAEFRHDEGAEPAEVAEHLLASEPRQEQWVMDVLLAAAQSAMAVGEPRRAVRLLRRALSERPDRAAQEGQVLLRLAEAQVRGDVEGALKTLDSALKVVPEAEVDLGMFNVLMLDGRRSQAAAIAAKASGATAARMRARLSWRPADASESVAMSEDALMSAVGTLSRTLAGQGRLPALAVAAELTDRAPADVDVMFAQVISADLFGYAGQLASATQACDSVVNAAEYLRHWPALAYALSSRAQIQRRAGRLGAAELDAERALDLAATCGMSRTGRAVRTMLACLVELALDRGDTAAASELLTVHQPVGADIAEPGGEALLFARARLRAADGDLLRACSDLERCGDLLTSIGVRNPAAIPWRSELARLLGAVPLAKELCDEEVELARQWGAPATVGRALLAGSGPMIDEAVDLLAESEDRFLFAQALLQCGVQRAGNGDLIGARRELRRGHEIAAELDCAYLSGRIGAELVTVGSRPPKPKLYGVGGLTEAESRVARLVVLGHKNREIARMLFVRERTVEVHLTRIYRKLGIEGRAALVSLLGPDE
ncbi:LuxR C-terminal-related transcriptional regulator [Lentzea alba]|uniref:AAA family ATPase n=1 Tax=Lentzea alba TaxID=2714351 RepID=UPI0039BEDBE8